MNPIRTRLETVRERIRRAERLYGREPGSVKLLAVSKTRSASDLLQAMQSGQRLFGESYLQEALEKMRELDQQDAEWHYIGRIQSNKTRLIAENFDWVHSVDKPSLARRLNDQRPGNLPPLHICLQVKLDQEETKGGLTPEQTAELAALCREFPRLRLRGLMTLPAVAEGLAAQRRPFQQLHRLMARLNTPENPLDTLSMGMSGDLEAAIAEGATIVRIGTAIFGPRNRPPCDNR